MYAFVYCFNVQRSALLSTRTNQYAKQYQLQDSG